MASRQRRAPRKQTLAASISVASHADFSDLSSSDGSSNDVGSSDFSSDDDTPAAQGPQASTSACRVSTTYGRDTLPNSSRRVKFLPTREPGAYVGAVMRSDRFCRALDFFLLFFTTEVIKTVCENTNKYAWMHILEKQTYSRRDGSWEEVTPLKMLRLIGLIIYMGLVEVPRLHLYWRTTGTFSDLLPPNIM
ncbi:hypothetical protein HPB51_024383 [Rhipicephalus microplus]|uniref:PiggyBac transposable element-derived protein domain-containing protein n=1 Tax=Rhipicephalus microplus TaxID=6941 RepID=A0A9J6D7H3_RHIMP|nr:hypothetical protein HPB51_024383 [Rhipicephalus microplus]